MDKKNPRIENGMPVPWAKEVWLMNPSNTARGKSFTYGLRYENETNKQIDGWTSLVFDGHSIRTSEETTLSAALGYVQGHGCSKNDAEMLGKSIVEKAWHELKIDSREYMKLGTSPFELPQTDFTLDNVKKAVDKFEKEAKGKAPSVGEVGKFISRGEAMRIARDIANKAHVEKKAAAEQEAMVGLDNISQSQVIPLGIAYAEIASLKQNLKDKKISLHETIDFLRLLADLLDDNDRTVVMLKWKDGQIMYAEEDVDKDFHVSIPASLDPFITEIKTLQTELADIPQYIQSLQESLDNWTQLYIGQPRQEE